MPFTTLSPAEVFADVVKQFTDRDVIPHVVVGPLSEEQQRAGGISIMDAGLGKPDSTGLVTSPRMQLRCMGPNLGRVESIARHAGFNLDNIRGRVVAHQGSTNEDFLVHTVSVDSGPSAHRDTDETWEYLIFAEAMMGTTPVPGAP